MENCSSQSFSDIKACAEFRKRLIFTYFGTQKLVTAQVIVQNRKSVLVRRRNGRYAFTYTCHLSSVAVRFTFSQTAIIDADRNIFRDSSEFNSFKANASLSNFLRTNGNSLLHSLRVDFLHIIRSTVNDNSSLFSSSYRAHCAHSE